MKEGRTNIIEQAPVEVAQSGPGKGKGGKQKRSRRGLAC